MIELDICDLNGSEILQAFPQGAGESALPCIVFYHGFTSSKMTYSYFAVALANAGFRVIMVDAPDHGVRFSGNFAQRMQRFWPILFGNLQEFAALRQGIIDKGWLAEGRLAVGGASMGGMTALGIMTHHPDVKCAASLMGSGYFSTLSSTLYPSPDYPGELAQWEAGNNLERLGNRPLLLWHGQEDNLVPTAESYRLQQALKESGLDGQLTCKWEPGTEHRITPEALEETVNFFRKHL